MYEMERGWKARLLISEGFDCLKMEDTCLMKTSRLWYPLLISEKGVGVAGSRRGDNELLISNLCQNTERKFEPGAFTA
jgi:hypothetical protein